MNAFISMKDMEFKRELQEEKNTPSEEKSIGLNAIFEVIRIKQVVQEVPTPFAIGAHLQTWKLRLLEGFRFDNY